jgi:hypothetical protein
VKVALIVITIIACATNMVAQNYSISGHTLGGGGGTSAAGIYSVSGTIAQPVVGKIGAGNYALSGGFWVLVGAVQTPGAPLLSLSITSTNTVLVCWPSPSTGFTLQRSIDALSTNWVDVGQAPLDNGTVKSVTLNQPAGRLFFRLKK